MAEYRPARAGVLETMAEFRDRRMREVANFGREAEAAAHKAYGDAIRSGTNLVLRTQEEVNRYGAMLLGGRKPVAGRQPPPTKRPQAAGARQVPPRAKVDLNRSPVAKAVAGDIAEKVGNVGGLVRGGAHAVQGLYDGGMFVRRLMDPMDVVMSPPGQSAGAQLKRAAVRGAEYAWNGALNPQIVVQDVRDTANQMRLALDPRATPVAPTVGEEVRRRLNIGMNQGELAFDVGSLAVGGPLAKSAKALGAVSRASRTPQKYLAQGFTPREAAYLAEPYPKRAKGHHFGPQRAGLPKSYSESDFNILKPDGITRGDMYELHYKVDPHFHGTGLPDGGRWRGAALGLKKYGAVGRLWHGSPAPLKARVGGLGGGAGAASYNLQDEDGSW